MSEPSPAFTEAHVFGRPWRCTKGHVLGIVNRRGKVTRLMVLRQAVPLEAGARDFCAERGDVLGELTGTMEICCSICGGQRAWVPGEEAINELLKQRRMMYNKRVEG